MEGKKTLRRQKVDECDNLTSAVIVIKFYCFFSRKPLEVFQQLNDNRGMSSVELCRNFLKKGFLHTEVNMLPYLQPGLVNSDVTVQYFHTQ